MGIGVFLFFSSSEEHKVTCFSMGIMRHFQKITRRQTFLNNDSHWFAIFLILHNYEGARDLAPARKQLINPNNTSIIHHSSIDVVNMVFGCAPPNWYDSNIFIVDYRHFYSMFEWVSRTPSDCRLSSLLACSCGRVFACLATRMRMSRVKCRMWTTKHARNICIYIAHVSSTLSHRKIHNTATI